MDKQIMKKITLATLLVFSLCQSALAAIYSISPAGVKTSIPTLTAAATGASYSGGKIYITSTYDVTSISFPSDRKVVLEPGGKLNNSGAVVGDFIINDDSEHFIGSGTVVGLPGSSQGRIDASKYGVYPGKSVDYTVKIQALVDWMGSGTIYFKKGEYNLSSIIISTGDSTGFSGTLSFDGAGIDSTVFVSSATSGAVIDYVQKTPSAFYLSPTITNLTIKQTISGSSTAGIRFNGAIFPTVHNTLIKNMGGDGIQVKSLINDVDGVAELDVQKNYITGCGGWGINVNVATSTNSVSGAVIAQNRIISCAGGIKLRGQGGNVLKNTIAGSTTYPDVWLPYEGIYNYFWNVSGNWMEKGAIGGVLVGALLNGNIDGNMFAYNSAESGTYGVKIEKGQFISLNKNRISVYPGITYTAFYFSTEAINCDISGTYFQTIAGSQVKYVNAGTYNRIYEGKEIIDSINAVNAETVTSGTYTPDLFKGPIHRIIFSTAPAISFIKPLAYNDSGRRITLKIYNTTGGAVTPTFDSGYIVKDVPNIANNSYTVVDFFYDSQSAKWQQIGKWF